jgi:hypothetical protein
MLASQAFQVVPCVEAAFEPKESIPLEALPQFQAPLPGWSTFRGKVMRAMTRTAPLRRVSEVI